MIYLIGGAGYIGRHLQDELDGVVVDPVLSDCHPCFGSDVAENLDEKDTAVWLAGPRNSKSGRDFTLASAYIEEDWGRFIDAIREKPLEHRPQIILLSSMSVIDYPDNPYAQHKRTMERMCQRLSHERIRILRPGTVVGTTDRVRTLRADLGVHRILQAVAADIECYVNLDCIRAYVCVDQLTEIIRNMITDPKLKPVGYSTVASMSALFRLVPEIDHWTHAGGYSVCHDSVTVDQREIDNLANMVVKTLRIIRDKKVEWI